MLNPDLLRPGESPDRPSVPQTVYITKPLPAVKVPEVKHYICTVPSASLHRHDGKKLPFVLGYLATDLLYDQEYLDSEIAGGMNPYVRFAEPHEIREFAMKLDPKGTLTKEITAELEPQIRERVEAELREKLEAQIRAEMSDSGKKLAEVDSGPKTVLAGLSKITAAPATDANGNQVTVVSRPAPLGGIVNSSNLGGAAAGSASSSVSK